MPSCRSESHPLGIYLTLAFVDQETKNPMTDSHGTSPGYLHTAPWKKYGEGEKWATKKNPATHIWRCSNLRNSWFLSPGGECSNKTRHVKNFHDFSWLLNDGDPYNGLWKTISWVVPLPRNNDKWVGLGCDPWSPGDYFLEQRNNPNLYQLPSQGQPGVFWHRWWFFNRRYIDSIQVHFPASYVSYVCWSRSVA